MRFHLDENVDPAVAEGLRRHGIDVTVSKDVDLLSADDESQLDFALREARVLLTHDSDFLRFHANGVHHAGIVFSPKGGRTIGELIRGLIMVAECLLPEEMIDYVEFL